MTRFVQNGSQFKIFSDEDLVIFEELPVATYVLKYNEMAGYFFLERTKGFEVSGKIYGDTVKTADRIIHTFFDRPNSTGVALSGEKGSGKTLLSKLLSMMLADKGVPTIIINTPFCGDGFNQFIQSISTPTMVIFDEFEKVYDRDDQEKVLTLFDGTYPSKKLFVMTTNDPYRLDTHMRNRPGRIFYMIDYTGLSSEFVLEYCQDNVINKDNIPSVVSVARMFGSFNFDMLKAMVEEMNRYNETAYDVLEMLNAKPESDSGGKFDCTIKDKEGNDVPLQRTVYNGNPLKEDSLDFWTDFPEDRPNVNLSFSLGDIRRVDPAGEGMIYVNKDGYVLQFVRRKIENFDWRAF